MAVRNFWVEVEIDGRKTYLKGGPKAKDGGIYLSLFQRSAGRPITACTLHCYVDVLGFLVTEVYNEVVDRINPVTRIITTREP